MKLSELIECPFCGHDEFMMYGKPVGQVKYRQKFNGTVSHRNTDIYKDIKIEYTKTYCANCGRYLGNHKTDECSQRVKQALGIRKII
ncbi:MAG: hypothetical protein IJE16_07425 [Ruminococcus sp.]|nr:hypothetical protein [Ruminococcus sp.]